MKRLILILAAICACTIVRAQQQEQQEQQEQAAQPQYNVMEQLSEYVTVHQSDEVSAALAAHVERNARRTASGMADQTYSIRIFFDSGQTARGDSEAAAARFRQAHPGVPVTRSFSSPFFKVTVGNYATKADAANALKGIQQEFPTAFIVRN